MDRRVALSSRPVTVVVALGLAFVALGLAEVIGVIIGVGFDLYNITLQTVTALVFGAVLQQGLIFGGLSALYLWYRNRGIGWLGVSIPDFTGWLWVVSGWILAFVGAFVMGIVVLLAGLNPSENQISQIVANHPEALLVMIPVSILLIGPGEELLFRGVIQGSLRERFGPVIAISVATVIFASAHVTSLTGPLSGRAITIALLFIPALVFAVAYEQTGNLVVPALIHGLYDATLFGLQYLAFKFGATPPPGLL